MQESGSGFMSDMIQVGWKAGVNEKLLGDFIRKHNVRDKIFSQSSQLDRVCQLHANLLNICFEVRLRLHGRRRIGDQFCSAY